jgi:hypothetical protein
MVRKLLMTSVLVFIRPGTPGQLSVGAMITFFFLLLGLFLRPFCSSSLNNLNTGTLIAQFLTLFVGIMIVILDDMPAGTSEAGGDDRLDRDIMSFMVFAVNVVALAWPLVHKVLSGQLTDYYEMTMGMYVWCCTKHDRWCRRKELRAHIAAAEVDAELGFVTERQIVEITTPGQATSTEAAVASASPPPGWKTTSSI